MGRRGKLEQSANRFRFVFRCELDDAPSVWIESGYFRCVMVDPAAIDIGPHEILIEINPVFSAPHENWVRLRAHGIEEAELWLHEEQCAGLEVELSRALSGLAT